MLELEDWTNYSTLLRVQSNFKGPSFSLFFWWNTFYFIPWDKIFLLSFYLYQMIPLRFGNLLASFSTFLKKGMREIYFQAMTYLKSKSLNDNEIKMLIDIVIIDKKFIL